MDILKRIVWHISCLSKDLRRHWCHLHSVKGKQKDMNTLMHTKIYVNKKNEITLICSQCGRVRMQTLPSPELIGKQLKIKCSCRHVFFACIDARRHYRKRVRLNGKCSTVNAAGPFEHIIVEDISHSGIRFRTPWKNQCKVGGILRMTFVLDNIHR